MTHKADIALVDAHAKSVGRDYDALLPLLPGILHCSAHLAVHACVICGSIDPLTGQKGGNLFCRASLGDIHDARTRYALAHFEQLSELVFALAGAVREIGPFESAHQQVGFCEPEPDHDILCNVLRSGGGQRYHRNFLGERRTGNLVPDLVYHQVLRPEVVSPLRDTMRLIHHQIVDVHLGRTGQKQVGTQTLRRHIQELVIAVYSIIQRSVNLTITHPRTYQKRRNPPLAKVLHLILHQGNQRRHHNAYPLLHQSGHLEAHTLPSPRRHQRQHIPPRQSL